MTNACGESLFGSLKVERVNGMGFETGRRGKDEVIDRLAWYDSRSLNSMGGKMSPMQHFFCLRSI